MNLSVQDVQGDILIVSQFTLHASTKKGNRPSYIKAASPETAIPLYKSFIKQMQQDLGKTVITGEFGAYMQVSLTNDGPVTISIDTKNKEVEKLVDEMEAVEDFLAFVASRTEDSKRLDLMTKEEQDRVDKLRENESLRHAFPEGKYTWRDEEITNLYTEGVLGWRKLFLEFLEAIAAEYSVQSEQPLEELADMLSAIIEGGIVLTKVLNDNSALPAQLLQYRNYIRLVFSRAT